MEHLSSFQEANLQIVKNNKNTYLTGTLKMYSSQTKEKERPMYLSLIKKGDEVNNQVISISPNPFSEEFCLYLNLDKTSNVLYNLFAFFDVLGQIHFCSLYESYYEQSEFSRLYAKV